MASINIEILEQLSAIKKWTPLTKILNNIEQDKFFNAHYYSMNDSIYIQLTPFYKNDFSTVSDTPLASAILYTGGKGSASRIIDRNIEADDGLSITSHCSIWPNNYQLTYKSAFEFFNHIGLSTTESASYRIATDGKFLFKSIENIRYKLFFRSNEISSNEIPFGILYKLEENET